MKILSKFWLLPFLLILLNGCRTNQKPESVEVLLLSGSNNHNWEATSHFLKRMYEETSLFDVKLTEKPDTLKESDLKTFDVVVSNWNSWPENDLRWPKELETALLNFIETGGGFVTFHASTSAFYKWPEFKEISVGAWVDSTWHGQNSRTQILIQNDNHPITKGLNGFFIFDELWVNAEVNSSFTVLGSATNDDISERKIKNQPAIFVKEFGKGKVFHTILGHDVRTMRNVGFQTLMLRGTEWAATGKVSQKIPRELKTKEEDRNLYSWEQTDSTFTLLNNKNTVWQYNFNEKHGKPFFHPIYLGRNNLTSLSPDDHIWHVGQWFSWKYINGVNYWEYQNGTYHSEGVTEITKIQLVPKDDFSAEIRLDIFYHPVNGKNVLAEKRVIKIYPPENDASLTFDYSFDFKALADSVDINRTPIMGEPGGQSWGGYAGLSIRFNLGFMEPFFIYSKETKLNGQINNWIYMGMKGIDDNTFGTQIMVSPETNRIGSEWYALDYEDHPFYFFSPAYIYHKPLLLLINESLQLKYRIKHYKGNIPSSELEKEFELYKQNQ